MGGRGLVCNHRDQTWWVQHVSIIVTSGCWSSSGELTENQPTTPPSTARNMRRVPPPAAMANLTLAACWLLATIAVCLGKIKTFRKNISRRNLLSSHGPSASIEGSLFYLELNCSLHHLRFYDEDTAQRICSKVVKWFRLLTGRLSKTRKVFLASNRKRGIIGEPARGIIGFLIMLISYLLYNQLKRRCSGKNFERLSFSPSGGFIWF